MAMLRATKTWCACIVVIVAVDYLAAGGQSAGGTGEPNDPYQIATVEQLLAIGSDANLLDRHFILISDIDLDPNLPGGQVFTRAVMASDTSSVRDFQGVPFVGTFDGNNHAILHLTIGGSASDCLGLFGKVGQNGMVRRLVLKDVSIGGLSSVGSVAGLNSGTIEACRVTCRLHGTGYAYQRCAGVTGENEGRIVNCRVEGSIVSDKLGLYCAGLAGLNYGTIADCIAVVDITVGDSGAESGGLVGQNAGCIRRSCAAGNVSGGRNCRFLAGLVGTNNTGSIAACYATGSVSAGSMSNRLAGLVGGNVNGAIASCYAIGDVFCADGAYGIGGLAGDNYGSITNCWAGGSVSAGDNGGYIGGLIGANVGSSADCYSIGRVSVGKGSEDFGALAGYSARGISHCFWNMDTSGLSESAGGAGLTTAQMKNVQTYVAAGWDLVDERTHGTCESWLVPDGEYPALAVISDSYVPPALKGAGTADDPYQIRTAEDLGAMSHHDPSACYSLVADVNLAGITWPSAPVADFSGVFDGAGFAISGLTIRGEGHLGLFGILDRRATVRDLRITDVNIVAGDGAAYAGALVGYGVGDVTNCRVWGTVVGGHGCQLVGGLAGVVVDCALDDCRADVRILAADDIGRFGGLAGASWEGTLIGCSASGTITCGDEAEALGGLLGSNSAGSVYRCHATGDICAGQDANSLGGLVGHNLDDDSTLKVVPATITECYAMGDVSSGPAGACIGGLVGKNGGDGYRGILGGRIANCYARGPILAGNESESLGGLVGWNRAGSIANCYAVGSVLAGSAARDLGGLLGKNSGDAATSCYFLSSGDGGGPANGWGRSLPETRMKRRAGFTGWDFAMTWMICEGTDYPHLRWEQVTCE